MQRYRLALIMLAIGVGACSGSSSANGGAGGASGAGGAGGAGHDGGAGAPADGAAPDGAVGQSKTAVVGPAGASIDLFGHGTLVIPPGALSGDVEITVAEAAPPVAQPEQVTTLTPVIALSPHGLALAVPATLTLDGEPDAWINRLDDPADTTWEALEPDSASATDVSVAISGFSFYQTVAASASPGQKLKGCFGLLRCCDTNFLLVGDWPPASKQNDPLTPQAIDTYGETHQQYAEMRAADLSKAKNKTYKGVIDFETVADCRYITGDVLFDELPGPAAHVNPYLPNSFVEASLKPMWYVRMIGGKLSVYNTEVPDLDGLQGLRWVGHLDIVGNRHITSLSYLSALEGFYYLTVSGNCKLPQSKVTSFCKKHGDTCNQSLKNGGHPECTKF